jgi:hypothetical protein
LQTEEDKLSEDGKNGNTTENGAMNSGAQKWPPVSELEKVTSSTPAVICRSEDNPHDIIYYTNNGGSVWHYAYTAIGDVGKWNSGQAYAGNFIGDPTIVSFNREEWHFFGVQANNELQLRSYQP